MDKVLELARRRGFIWPSFEIYGGASGFYDYGPLGASLKNKLENLWRKFFVAGEGYMEISSPSIGVEEVFLASGHVSQFTDPIVTCEKCKESFRADHLLNDAKIETEELSIREMDAEFQKQKIKCPSCKGSFSNITTFNMMFKTDIGAGARTGYLRPETAQNIFILFPRLFEFYRKKLPFGVAQIGRAYRNEISPRQGLIRLREFSQAEIEVFVAPEGKDTHEKFHEVADIKLKLLPDSLDEANYVLGKAIEEGLIAHQFLGYHIARTYQFLLKSGVSKDLIRFRQHKKTEMAHYACDCWDAEVLTDRYGWVEVVGIADRTDYDLTSHANESGVDMSAFIRFDEPKIERRDIMEPDMKKIGQKFKRDASKIAGLIKGSDPSNISKDGSLDIGEGMIISSEYFALKNIEERIEGHKIVPHVIEPSFGIDRIIYCILESAYSEEERNKELRTVLKLNPEVAPYDVTVFPLVSKDGLDKKARGINEELKGKGHLVLYDDSGTIGRRYARADEIGVPYAVTVDFQTLEDGTVTIRDRDTTKQERVRIQDLSDILKQE